MLVRLLFSLLLLYTTTFVQGQGGISIFPARLYYLTGIGESRTQMITINNPGDKTIDVGVSLGDWDYAKNGQNRMYNVGTLSTSCASWFRILPSSYFSIPAGESRNVSVVFNTPEAADKSIFTRTAMIYFTQLNPSEMPTTDGAAIRVAVRIGVKVYHAFEEANSKLDVVNFTKRKDSLKTSLILTIKNKSSIWADGKVVLEFLNTRTGKKVDVNNIEFYTLPGDERDIYMSLPEDLAKGQYTVTAFVNYGNRFANLEMAELDFTYE